MTSSTGLKYQIHGTGEPVLLIHGGHIADTYRPLVAEPLFAPYRKITYRRRGYADSPSHIGPFSIEDAAGDALRLLKGLGIERAHVVGHSSGGIIALQMALSAPQAVNSLVLLEPALMMVPSAPAFFAKVGPALEKYTARDRAGAVAAFIGLVAGPNWQAEVTKIVPGGIEQAVKDAATFFDVELPAIGEWQFTARQAREIFQPVLYVIGSESDAVFKDGKELCEAWIPHTEAFVVHGAKHHLQHEDPSCSGQVARGLSKFFARHPMAA